MMTCVLYYARKGIEFDAGHATVFQKPHPFQGHIYNELGLLI